MIACDNCGAPVEENAQFCGHCGEGRDAEEHRNIQITEVRENASTIYPPQSRSSRVRVPITRTIPATNRLSYTPPPRAVSHTISSPQHKKRSTFQIIAAFLLRYSILISILVIGCLFFYGVISSSIYDSSPEKGLQVYCDDVKGQLNYDNAYAHLSSRETGKSKITKDQFITRFKGVTGGKVDGIGDCTVHITNQYGDIAHGTITYTYGNGSQATKSYEVFKNSNADMIGSFRWLIETRDWDPTTAPVA